MSGKDLKETNSQELRGSRYKPKARKSFSIPKKECATLHNNTEPVIKKLQSQENVKGKANSTYASSIRSKISTVSDMVSESTSDDEWSTEDDDCESDVSVEQMRSSELISLDELVLPPPKEVLNPASFEIWQQDGCPIAHSTLLSPLRRKAEDALAIPSVSYIEDKKSDTSEETPPLPGVNYLKIEEKDTFVDPNGCPRSNGFEIYGDLDEYIEQNFDEDNGDFSEKNSDTEDVSSFEISIVSRSTNANSQRRKHDDREGNLFGDVYDYDNGDSSGNQDIESRKKRVKFNKEIKSNHVSRLARRKHENEAGKLFEDMIKSDSDDNFKNVMNIQNEEFSEDEIPPVSHHRKRVTNTPFRVDNKTRKYASVSRTSQNSTSVSKKHEKLKENSFKDMDNNHREDCVEEAQNIHFDTPNGKEKLYRGAGIESDSRMNTTLRRKRKSRRKLFEDTNKNDSEGSLENVQNFTTEEVIELDKQPPVTHQRKSKKNNTFGVVNEPQKNASILNKLQNTKSRNSKHYNEGRNLLEEANENDSGGSFENDQNIQNQQLPEGELEKRSPRSGQGNRNVDNCLRVGNETLKGASIPNRSQNSTFLSSKRDRKGGNSFEDINESFHNVFIENEESKEESDNNNPLPEAASSQRNSNNQVGVKKKTQKRYNVLPRTTNYNPQSSKHGVKVRNSFEDEVYTRGSFKEAATIQSDNHNKKSKRDSGVRNLSNNRIDRSQKTVNSLKDSKSLQDGRKTLAHQWPLCCILASHKTSVPILKPIIWDGMVIDDLTLLSMGEDSKKKCKH